MLKVIKQAKFASGMGVALLANVFFVPGAYALELDPSNWVPGFSLAGEPTVEEAGATISRLKEFGMAFFALATITCIIFFLVAITKLGAAGDDVRARKMALQRVMWAGAAVIMLGGLSTILAFMWGFLRF